MTATFQRYLGQLDRVLAQIEHDRGIVEPSAATARRFTTADNKRWWNDHDWSHRGEEWTPCEAWKAAVRDGFLFPSYHRRSRPRHPPIERDGIALISLTR